jgi:hypothetical protein
MRRAEDPKVVVVLHRCILYIALARSLEEEPDDKHLQTAHADDEGDLDHAEVDDAVLGTVDGAEVSVLSGAEVLLAAGDGGDLAGDLEEGLLNDAGLLGRCALLGRQLGGSALVLDLQRENSQGQLLFP